VGGVLPDSGDFLKVSASTVAAGNYVVIASVGYYDSPGDENTVYCELRHGSTFIGGQKSGIPSGYRDSTQLPLDWGTMTVTGGLVGAAGDEVSMWCRAEGHDSDPAIYTGHMMILKVGGFV